MAPPTGQEVRGSSLFGGTQYIFSYFSERNLYILRNYENECEI